MKNRNQEEQAMGVKEEPGPPERTPLMLAAKVEDLINTGRAQIKDDILRLPTEEKDLYDEVQSLKESNEGNGFESLVETLANHNPDSRFSEVMLESPNTTEATFDEIYERAEELKVRARETRGAQTVTFTVKSAMAVDKQRTLSRRAERIHHAQFADKTATFPMAVDNDTFKLLKTLVTSNLTARKPNPAYGTPCLYDLIIEGHAIPKLSRAGRVEVVDLEFDLIRVENERVRPRDSPTEQTMAVLGEKPHLIGVAGLDGLGTVVIFESTRESEAFFKRLPSGTVTHTSDGLFFGRYPAGVIDAPQWRLGLAYVHPKVYIQPGGRGLPLDVVLRWSATRTHQCSRGTMTEFGALLPLLLSYETFEHNRQTYTGVDRSTPVSLVLKEDATEDILDTLINSPPLREEDLAALGLDRHALLRVLAVTNTPRSQRVIREAAEHFGHTIQEVVAVLPTKIFKEDAHGVFVEDQQAMFAYVRLLRAVLDEGGDPDLGEFALRMGGSKAHEILGGDYKLTLEKLEKHYGLVNSQASDDREYSFQVPRECWDAARALKTRIETDDGVTGSEELRKGEPNDAGGDGEVDS